MNIISLLYKIVTDSRFRNAVLLLLEITKTGTIKEYSFVNGEEQKTNFVLKQIEVCKKDIDTLDSVISHVKKYEPANTKLISEVNSILNDLKHYYRTFE